MGRPPSGFTFTVRGADVLIARDGVLVTTLRGPTARRFRTDVERDDPQELMARVTGNYRRGNERVARQHPRNVGRAHRS